MMQPSPQEAARVTRAQYEQQELEGMPPRVVAPYVARNGGVAGRVVLLCALFDTKAGEIFGQVFTVRTQGEAIRLFQDAVTQRLEQPSVLQTHPEDFELVQLGQLDVTMCDVEASYSLLLRGSEVAR